MTSRLIPKGRLEQSLGRRFKRTRERAGITYRTMASGVGRSIYALQRHEAGAMMLRVDDLIRAAAVLGCSPCELLEGMTDGRNRSR